MSVCIHVCLWVACGTSWDKACTRAVLFIDGEASRVAGVVAEAEVVVAAEVVVSVGVGWSEAEEGWSDGEEDLLPLPGLMTRV